MASLFSNSGPDEDILANFEPELQEMILSAEIPPPEIDEFDSVLEFLERESSLFKQRSIVKKEFNTKRKNRTAFTNDQLFHLEMEFINQGKYLCRSKRIKVARDLSLDERQVKVWFQNRRVKDKKAESIKCDKDKEMNSKTALPDTKIECKKRHVEIEKEKTFQNASLAASAPAPAFASGSVIYGENQMHTLNYSSHSSSDTHNHHLSSWNLHNRINYDMMQNHNSNNFNGLDGRTLGNNHHAAIYSDSYNLNYNYISNNNYYYPPGYNYQTADFIST